MIPLSALIKHQLQRESLLLIRQLRHVINANLFFLMALIFFPLTLPPGSTYLRHFVPGLVWIAVLLAALLSAERLFQPDEEEGVVEQWLVSGQPISVYVLTKLFMHWIFTIVPIIVLCPVLSLFFSLNEHEVMVLIISLICGTPALFFLCALASVFSIPSKQKGIFMAIILMPLTIPIMIFGSGALAAAMNGLAVHAYLAILLALSLLAVSLLPFAIASVMRATF